MKKILALMIFSIFCMGAYSQDGMNKKMENKTDKMNVKPEIPNDPMNKKMGTIIDSTRGSAVPVNPDSVRHKSRSKPAVKKKVTK